MQKFRRVSRLCWSFEYELFLNSREQAVRPNDHDAGDAVAGVKVIVKARQIRRSGKEGRETEAKKKRERVEASLILNEGMER